MKEGSPRKGLSPSLYFVGSVVRTACARAAQQMRTKCAQSMKCFVVKRGEKKNDNYKTDIRECNSSFASNVLII